ncbi:hypothetical protein B566_EDAN006743 [Ephemera danica]|nr:hypothetical protein B566_EDAN006743 [Ephemera danica]
MYNQVVILDRFYWILMPIVSFLLPVNAPVEYWGESIMTSICVVGMLRHVILLHAAWLVHSGPVLWGLKDGQSSRWHEYHYMLPWDYRTNEYGSYGDDVATHLIEFTQRQGWASGLRTCSDEAMAKALDLAMDLKIPLRESVERIVEQESS